MKIEGINPTLHALIQSLEKSPSLSPQVAYVAHNALTLADITPCCYQDKALLYDAIARSIKPMAEQAQKNRSLLSQFCNWIYKSQEPEAIIQRVYRTCL